MMSPGRIVLASASPRRRDLLQAIGCEFIVDASDIDETEHAGEDPVAYVQRVAIGKARAFHALPDDLIIAADTTVDVDGRILAKPVDADDARRMLALLNGRTHLVHSAIAVRFANTCEFGVETTAVTFRSLSSDRRAHV